MQCRGRGRSNVALSHFVCACQGAGDFHAAVEVELEKVNRFYVEKTKEYAEVVETLAESTPFSPPPPPPGTPPPSPGKVKSVFKEDDSSKLLQLNLVYRRLGQLQNYVWINNQGFSKIMKKFDKRTGSNLLETKLDELKALHPYRGTPVWRQGWMKLLVGWVVARWVGCLAVEHEED